MSRKATATPSRSGIAVTAFAESAPAELGTEAGRVSESSYDIGADEPDA